MTQRTKLHLSHQFLCDEYLGAINDLTFSSDSHSAIFLTLERLAKITQSSAGICGIYAPTGTDETANHFVSSHFGDFFSSVNTFSELQELAASHGWGDTQNHFRCTMRTDTLQPEQILSGYPLFNQKGDFAGFLMFVVSSEESLRILEETFPIIIHLMIHRITELSLTEDRRNSGGHQEHKIFSKRATYFPSVNYSIFKNFHDINGQLAVASLQTEFLKNQSTPSDSWQKGLNRIEQSLTRVGEYFSAQEKMISLILSQENQCSFVEALNLAIGTFQEGEHIHNRFEITTQISPDQALPFSGSASLWLLHNILRVVADVYQQLPQKSDVPIPLVATIHQLPNRDSLRLSFRLPSDPLLTDTLNKVIPQSSTVNEHQLLPLAQVVREILILGGGDFSYSEEQKQVAIVAIF